MIPKVQTDRAVENRGMSRVPVARFARKPRRFNLEHGGQVSSDGGLVLLARLERTASMIHVDVEELNICRFSTRKAP